ncbi:hypothetical protein FJTKL_03034 [Diaporthe vaccinii]|uniref:Uncharacterized protein n=1 Tax=Diaporthe vaccinii TaxID=105482 RepID=A0ABR4DWC3_9PEZI
MTRSSSTNSDAEHPDSPRTSSVASSNKLWNDGEIPTEANERLRTLSGYEREEKARKAHAQRFDPRNDHCGIWTDAPNQRCHASFGDGGTTASVSCFGELIQMSQFLGIGSSGFFAIDHISTPKPYDICGRAQALDDLAKNEADRDSFSFGFRLDQRLQPQEPPNVKWVDWRWPRYE